MSTVVTLKLDRVTTRIRATLSIAGEQRAVETEVSGWLPQPRAVLAAYSCWQATYHQLTRSSSRIVARDAWDRAGANPIARLQTTCKQQAEALRTALNVWLQDEAFAPLLSAWYDGMPEASMEARVMIRTESSELRRLPWHLWDVLAHYPNLEVALGSLDFKMPPLAAQLRGRIRILAILGYATDIDIGVDWEHLKASFPTAEIHELQRPSRQQLEDSQLWEQAWDLLFFAGHSQTEGETGRIFFNPDSTLAASEQSLTLKELQPYLKLAIAKGLQIAIFNSCDGLGLAEELEQLHIPQTIVMREPVPDTVAQQFLEQFLQAYARVGSLYVAMRQAREQLRDLENSYPGASWLPVIIQNPAVPPPSWLALSNEIPPCPYKGLFAFEEADEAIFFGRMGESEELYKRLQTERLVAVVGPSGSGKSSLVQAGLLPQLQRDNGWQIVQFRPGENPLNTLAIALAAIVSGDGDDIKLGVAQIAIALTETNSALTQFLNDLPQQRLLLVADQFEEIYTLTADSTVRTAFLENLLSALQNSPKLRLVLTVRADFLGAFYTDAKFHRLLDRAKFNLYPMEPDALQHAILEPARLQGVYFEAGLVELLMADAGKREEDLPLLEFSLTQLWNHMVRGILTHQAYRKIGDLQGALAQHAEAVYKRLSPEQQGRARQLFGQLVQPGEGTVDTRNIATRAELGEAVWQLATLLNAEANRLVLIGTNANDAGGETVEIVHEALIQEWSRLQQWLQADREFRIWQERLRSRQRQWQENNQAPAYLLRGTELTIATDWLQQRGAELLSDRKFIVASQAASEAERQRGQRRRRGILVGSLAIASLTSILAVIAVRQTQHAQWSEALAQLQTTHEQARRLAAGNSELEALLKAVEMGRRARVLETRGRLTPDRRLQTAAVLFDLLYNAREYNRLEGHTNRIEIVTFRSDGQLLATGAIDGLVKLWSPTGELLQTLDHRDLDADGPLGVLNHDGQYANSIGAIAFNPDGRTLATTSQNYTVKLWSLEGQLLQTFDHGTVPHDIRFSPDGRTLVAASGRRVWLWDLDGRLLDAYKSPEPISTLYFTTSRIVSAQAAAGEGWQWSRNPSQNSTMATSPDGHVEAEIADLTVSLRRQRDRAPAFQTAGGKRIPNVRSSPDGQVVARIVDGIAHLWSRNGRLLQTAGERASRVSISSFSPDGQILALEIDGIITLWHRDGRLLPLAQGRISWSPDGEILALGADENSQLQLWSRDGRLLHALDGHGDGVAEIAFAPDSQSLMAFMNSNDLSFKVWSRDGQLLSDIESPLYFVRPQYSPNSQTIATVQGLWSLEGKQLFHFEGDRKGFLETIVFSPNSQVLAVRARSDLSVTLYHRNGEILHALPGATGVLGFSPDGQIVAAAHRDRTIKVWDLKTGLALQVLTGQPGEITHIEFSPDSQAIAAAVSGEVMLWSRDGELLHQFPGTAKNLWSSLDLSTLLVKSCAWLESYLQFNPNGRDLQPLCRERN